MSSQTITLWYDYSQILKLNYMDKTSDITKQYFRTDLPPLQIGDKVEITTKNINQNEKKESDEKQKQRLTRFKGTIIAQKNPHQISYTFSALKEGSRVVVESVFLYHSPLIVKIEKLGKIKLSEKARGGKKARSRKIRQAKLYFLERKLAKKKDNG